MKIEYDSKHDLMNIEFLQDEPIVDSLEVNGVIIDYAKDGKIVSIEILADACVNGRALSEH